MKHVFIDTNVAIDLLMDREGFADFGRAYTDPCTHIVDGDGRVKIQVFPEVKLISNEGMKPKNAKRAMQLAKMYKEDIIAKWYEYHGKEDQNN